MTSENSEYMKKWRAENPDYMKDYHRGHVGRRRECARNRYPKIAADNKARNRKSMDHAINERKRWSSDEKKTLLEAVESGVLTWPQLAKVMGRSLDSLNMMYFRLTKTNG